MAAVTNTMSRPAARPAGALPAGAAVEAMAAHLAAVRPASGTEALRILRTVFPDASLSDRARAAEKAVRAAL